MLFPDLSIYDRLALDTETDGLALRKNRPFSFSISTPGGHGQGPIGPQDFYFDSRDNPNVFRYLQDQMREIERKKTRLIFHNAPFDCTMFDEVGVKLPLHLVEDTGIYACLINEHEFEYGLDYLTKKYTGGGKKTDIYEELAKIFGGVATKNVQMKNLHRAPSAIVAPYAMQDTRETLALWEWQQGEIARQELERVVAFERRCQPHFIKATMRGVRVDLAKAEQSAERIDRLMEDLQKQLNDIAGFKCNPNPSGDTKKLFQPKRGEDGVWRAIDGTVLEATPAGNPSINADALREMKHPAAAIMLKIRKYYRVANTFIRGHILSNAVGDRVYPSINQTKGDAEGGKMVGTGTGRLSYSQPALQQISKRDKELAEIVRQLFLPEEGHKWSVRDWSQTDFRFMAHYTQQPKLLQAYEKDPGVDFHKICSELTGVPRDAPYAGGANAKQINLGLVFGMGEGKLASEMGLPYTVEVGDWGGMKGKQFLKAGPEAKAFFAKYHSQIPGIKDFMKKAEKIAKQRGWVKSMFGRHIRFPGGNATHKAAGLLFQAATAELMKDRFATVAEYLESVDGYVILSIHDELDNSIPNGCTKIDGEVRKIMQESSMYRVPLRTSGGMGDNWWHAMTNEVKEV